MKKKTVKTIKIDKEREATLLQIKKLEKSLVKTCQKIYELSMMGRRFKPIHPYVLVRVLPKEFKTEGGIWLADVAQNKPLYEGIVLETWRPYEEYRPVYDVEGERSGTTIIKHECALKIGDRISFPHFEGMPAADYLDDKYYRFVREGADQNKFPFCSVFGKLDYHGDHKIQAKIRKLMMEFGSITTSGVPLSRGANPKENAA